MKKILIAVPSMDFCPVGFAQSLATLNKVGDCAISFNVGSLIYDARNNLSKQAIHMEADYVMWFDSDMIFAPDTLERMVKHMEEGRDIVSGLYFRRSKPYTPVLFKKLNLSAQYDKWEGYDDYPQELFEVEGIGFGCVMMKTEVLIDMACEFVNWFEPLNGFGEDLAFCIRARQLGYKIWCDPTIKCGHMGHTIITEDFYKAFKEN